MKKALISLSLIFSTLITLLLVTLLVGSSLTSYAGIHFNFEKNFKEILKNSPGIKVQKELMESSFHSNAAGRLVFYPTLSVGLSRDFSHTGTSSPVTSQSYTGSANINIIQFGGKFGTYMAAQMEKEIQEAQLNQTLLTEEVSAADALFGEISTRLILKVQERNTNFHKDSVRIAQQRFAKGLLAKQEVDKLKIDLENDKAQQRDAEVSHYRAVQNVYQKLHPRETEIPKISTKDEILKYMDWPWQELMEKGDYSDMPLSKILQNTPPKLSVRPSWNLARSRYLKAEYTQLSQFGSFMPALDFGVTYGSVNSISNTTGSFTEWTTSLSLSIPLFDRLSRYGAYRSSIHEKRRSEILWTNERSLAIRDWQIARHVYEISVQTAIAREKNSSLANNLWKINLTRLQRGRANANDLAVDEARLSQAESLAINGWKAAHEALISLCHSAGLRIYECIRKNSN